jgi:branched-chain amino acid transport system ATP-binding protein
LSGLVISSLSAGYGDSNVLRDISLDLKAGDVTVVLGANGAGKTTLLRAISGMLKQVRGNIEFDRRQLLGAKPGLILRAGIAHVPQGRGTFFDLTVEENLRVGGLSRPARDIDGDMDIWYQRLPKLGARRKQLAGSLSGGEQQMLAIARAFMAHPRYVLFDEPSLGLAPLVVEQLFELLRTLSRESGIGMLVVEQNADLALEIASQAYVIEAGRIVASGTAVDMANNDAVRRAYLGA